MYESLTVFIPGLETGKYGEWEKITGDGSPDNPFWCSNLILEKPVQDLIKALNAFRQEQKIDMRDVRHIIEASGISSFALPLKEEVIASLDGPTIIAIFLYNLNLTRIDNGLFLDFCECGNALCLLNRLKEIDEAQGLL